MAFHSTAIPLTPTAQAALVEVSIKNTFIDGFFAQAVVPSRRRCSSLPPKFRLFHDEGLHCQNSYQDMPCTVPLPFRKASGFTVKQSSTEEENASTEIATSEGEDTFSKSEVGANEVDDTSMEAEATSSEGSPHLLQSSLVPKTCLNSRAKAWNPDDAFRTWPNRHCMDRNNNIKSFRLQLTTVVAATRMALLNCAYVLTAETEETPESWSMVVRIPPKDARFKDAALTVTKQALLNAAVKSQHVYVCGYRHRPFVATPEGFIATLSCVTDENTACWGLVQQGFCKFGQRCQWKHPEMQIKLTVTVVFEDVNQQ